MTEAVAALATPGAAEPAAHADTTGAATPGTTTLAEPLPVAPLKLDVVADPSVPLSTEKAAPSRAVQYQPSGDAGLDLALTFVGQRGFGPDHPAIAAAQVGDFGLIKAELAGLGPKAAGWEQYLALAEKAYTQGQTEKAAAQAETASVVYDAAGGEESWATIQTWAAENADESERVEINAMLRGGKVQARAAAIMLKNAYEQAHASIVADKTPRAATKAAPAAAPAASGALGPKEYAAAVAALRAEKGWGTEKSPEYQQLRARFRAN